MQVNEESRNENDVCRFHDKRKAEGIATDEDVLQPVKRIRQPEVGGGTGTTESTHIPYQRKKLGERKRFCKKDSSHNLSAMASPPLTKDEEDDDLDKILNDVPPEEVENLRKRLEDGDLGRHFNWTFWNYLNLTYSSHLGYTFGFLLIILMNHSWMLEEVADDTEGHSVSKVFVILFVIFSYSFITLGLEVIQMVYLIAKIYYPNFCVQLWDDWSEFRDLIGRSQTLNKLRSSKYFFSPFAVMWCIFSAFVGSKVWYWFWWNHICKSYHDRTCKKSWLGKLVRSYRDQACYDGTASSIICERFVSYLPIMIFAVLFTFVGNVVLPLINDWLSLYYPISPQLEIAFDIMQRMNENSEGKNPSSTSSVSLGIKTNFNFAEVAKLQSSSVTADDELAQSVIDNSSDEDGDVEQSPKELNGM